MQEEKLSYGTLSPLEAAGRRQADLELPGRKCGTALEKLGSHQGREEQPMVPLPHGGD